ncbi:AbrB family transcriptional regulator [Sporosarcina sp. P18a]|uniref:AbrB/MazE/SpoVT family DNA-binding domain-containing protein n=1 Tax=Sporosarcina sp. P18a TaxID=2048259 RepID=UPI000C16957F|nr:AbrB/MazE/SpoVT family DNA-binding domain-containing protein [Sporosarcina sp. P18a]PIC80519.1 AbrB family transcriptional regulator [Sporosarcina sp. P18a]
MKALGIIRKIDNLGRLVIPMEVRKTQGWEEGQAIEFFMNGNKLVIQSYEGERKKEEAIGKLEKLRDSIEVGIGRQEMDSVIDYLKGVD